MLAVSPQLCSVGWFLEDPFTHFEQENIINCFSVQKAETSGSIDLDHTTSSNGGCHGFVGLDDGFHPGDDTKMVKKLNHNASERDRRQKMNTLYSTLRSLLPPKDQSRRLSIPATVSRVLKYIPELQKEVERLIQKKESLDLMPKISKQDSSQLAYKNHTRKPFQTSLSAVSATRIGDGEIILQISMPRAEKGCSLSEIILNMEEEGFLVMNASCFESFDRRTFYSLHLQAQGSEMMDAEMLKEKVWSFHEKVEEIVLT